MSRRVFGLIVVLMIGLLSFSVVAAQSTTPEPTPQGELSLTDVVGNKSQYYGQAITTEGTIEQVVNVRAFVLGDKAALNDHQILVINNSDQDFDLGVKQDQPVRVTGTLYPDFNSGGWMQLVGATSVNGPSPTEQANATQAPGATQMPASTVMPGATPMVSATTAAQAPMATAVMTPAMTGTQQAMGGKIDLSQMFIPNSLRGFTILVMNELHITYLNTNS